MPIVLDPAKNFVTIQIMYIEQKDEKHGNSRFVFINNREEFENWKEKGYLTSDEVKEQSAIPEETKPGMPKKPTIDPKKVINILRTWWSGMTWKEQNIIYARCLRQTTDVEGRIRSEIDMISFRDLKLKSCLKKWDLKNDAGQDISISDGMIDNLYPEVAQELLNTFEKITEATGDELKN